MFNLFKKKESNDDFIKQWQNYCLTLGLTEGQILGLAYFNSALPTVLSGVNQNEGILSPLTKVVKEIGKSSSLGANPLYLYREFYFNARARNNEISHVKMDDLPADFFNDNNKYLKHCEVNSGMLMNSRLTVLLIQEVGKILMDYKINLSTSFELGHYHSNFFLRGANFSHNYTQAILMSNSLPQYIATAIEILPNPNCLALNEDLWLFSKILHPVLQDYTDDEELKAWLWFFHNAIFYENKPGSVKIKNEWNLSDPNFEINMISKIMDVLPMYYQVNPKIGNQKIGEGPYIGNWEEFFPLLNLRMRDEFELESPTTTFTNQGEMCNYMTIKYIAVIKTIFEHSEL
jgi:hypothetical protein